MAESLDGFLMIVCNGMATGFLCACLLIEILEGVDFFFLGHPLCVRFFCVLQCSNAEEGLLVLEDVTADGSGRRETVTYNRGTFLLTRTYNVPAFVGT